LAAAELWPWAAAACLPRVATAVTAPCSPD
jgi:hypothetical protein